MADELVAMSVRYLGAVGMYRAPGKGMYYNLALDSIERIEGGSAKPVSLHSRIDSARHAIRPTKPTGPLLEPWQWLVGDGQKVVAVTALGDLFLRAADGSVGFLDAGWGRFHKVAADVDRFKAAARRHAQDWFHVDLVNQVHAAGITPGPGQCLGCNVAPILGGTLDRDNLIPTDLEVHHSTLGQIHLALKDLPVGAKIKGIGG